MKNMNLLQNKLLLARKNAGLTRPEVCKVLGIGIQTLYRYEKGITIPSIEQIKILSKLYKVPITFFV